MVKLEIEIHSYIAHPYWPERERVINILKESGVNRARTAANRRKALEEYLGNHNMTLADFEELERLADRQFVTDAEGRIVIPKRQVDGMLVATCDNIRAANKPVDPEMVRTALRASQWITNATEEDALSWQRYAVVTSGAGGKLSNQRALRTNSYIGSEPPEGDPTKPITATGSVDLNPDMVKPEILQRALVWAGVNTGIGASRKMGWGRFTVLSFEPD